MLRPPVVSHSPSTVGSGLSDPTVRSCIATPPMPELYVPGKWQFRRRTGDTHRPPGYITTPRSIPPLPKKWCDNTTYRPHFPPLTSSCDVTSTSAPRHYCHLSARSSATSPSVPRYTTKNLHHDDVITKSAKKPIKPNFLKKNP